MRSSIGAYTLKGARLGSLFYADSHRCFSGSRRSMHSRAQSRDCLDVLLARRSVQGGDNRRHFRARSEGRHRNAASVHVSTRELDMAMAVLATRAPSKSGSTLYGGE